MTEPTEARVALISGGARGIGRAVAESLLGDGWRVAVCYRTSEADGRSLEAWAEARGATAVASRWDVSDPAEAERWVRACEGRFGRVDALIHAAGPYHRVALLEESVEGWNEMFDANLHALFYLARAVAPGMQSRGSGRIVAFGMANADQHVGQTHVTAHYIAKAGVLMLVRALAKSLAAHGVTVNAVSPGFIDSGSAPAEELAKMVRHIPAGYLGRCDDAVAVVRFLLGDDARYVNGTNVHLSGAWGV